MRDCFRPPSLKGSIARFDPGLDPDLYADDETAVETPRNTSGGHLPRTRAAGVRNVTAAPPRER